MQSSSVKFSKKYSTEWFMAKAISEGGKLKSKTVYESYWIYLLKKYAEYELNILEAKEMIDILSNVRLKEPTPLGRALVWEKIVQQIKDQGI